MQARVSELPVWLAASLVVLPSLLLASAGSGCADCNGRDGKKQREAQAVEPPATASAASNAGAAAKDGGTLRVQMEAEPATLNPLVEHDAWTSWIGLGALYDPLVRQDPSTGELSPSLALRWDQPDERTIHFVLRDGVRWSDGAVFGADDVVATLGHLGDLGVSADVRADFAALGAVDKVSPLEVMVRLERAAPLFLQSLAHLPMLPAHLLGAANVHSQLAKNVNSVGGPGKTAPQVTDLRQSPLGRVPVGTGPFRLVEWRPGDRIVLARSSSYWGPRPHLERVELVIVRDREAAFELFRRGQLDLLWRLEPLQIDRALGDPALKSARIERYYLPRYGYIVWNTRKPGLGDARVRRALTLLIDRPQYQRAILKGRARAVTGPYPLDSPSYDPTVAPWPYDPAQARALLDAAGVVDHDGDGMREVAGAPFKISFLLTAGSQTLEPLATMMQEDFRKSGVFLEIVPVEWAALLERLRRHDFDASSLQWVMQPVQDNYDLFHSSQVEHGQNYGAYQSPEADALLDAIHVAPVGAARQALDRKLHRLLHDEQPYTFLYSPEVDSLVAARVHGYAPDGAGLGLPSIWVDAGSMPRLSE